MLEIPQLAGKPFILKLDRKVRDVGEIHKVEIDPQRTELWVNVKLTDEEAAGLLGAAADKAALGSPLTESEIDDIVNGDEWVHQPTTV
jgi:hypothetical protein